MFVCFSFYYIKKETFRSKDEDKPPRNKKQSEWSTKSPYILEEESARIWS